MQVERKPMTREMYLEKMDEIKTIREQVQKDDKRLGYHLQPPVDGSMTQMVCAK